MRARRLMRTLGALLALVLAAALATQAPAALRERDRADTVAKASAELSALRDRTAALEAQASKASAELDSWRNKDAALEKRAKKQQQHIAALRRRAGRVRQ